MRRNVFLTFVLLLSISICNELVAQVGIGTDQPSNTLHIKPVDPNEDPLRIENLNELMQGDSALLIVDPSSGIVRYIHIDSLVQYMANNIDVGKDEQNASEVPLEPGIDITNNGVEANNVQEALEAIQKVKEGIEVEISSDLMTIDIREALYHLGEITGNVTTEDLLGNIFSNFCIGK